MKASRQTSKKVAKVPIECRAGIGSSTRKQKFKKSTTRHSQKATDKGGHLLDRKDEFLSSPYSAEDGKCLDFPERGVQFSETTNRLPVLEFSRGKILAHSKIKLQLYPVNESTRIGLEKDGHHPYLELILRPRKKVSSVLKHLNGKWGSSDIALGEPVLFPYKTQHNMSFNRKWTLNDGDISMGAVYKAIGSPVVFRLRYGWFSTESRTSDEPSASANDKVDLQSDASQRYSSATAENAYDEVGKPTVLARKKVRSINASETINPDTVVISAGSIVLMDDCQRRMYDNYAQLPSLVDSVTSISIGGLLSEASLQAKCNNSEKNQIGKDEGFLPTEIKSDSKSSALWADCLSTSIGGLLSEASFQGLMATQIKSPRSPRPSSHASCSSILDAEETCHAFPAQKFFSSGKDVLGLVGSFGCFSQHSSSKGFNNPNAAKVDFARQESDTDVMDCSRMNNDERSLGLSGIKWTESLGPFDLGMPVSEKLISGESTSISGFINSQLNPKVPSS